MTGGFQPACKITAPKAFPRKLVSNFPVASVGVLMRGRWRSRLTPSAGPKDFERLKLIGQGDVGKVYLVRLKGTDHTFAMKVLSKQEMIARNKVRARRRQPGSLAEFTVARSRVAAARASASHTLALHTANSGR